MSRQKFIDAISALDARIDGRAKDYFVDTGVAQRLRQRLSGGAGLVGLKGTGKTTLFRALGESWLPDSGVITISISPSTSDLETSSEKTNCLQFEQSVRRGMAISILDRLNTENAKSGHLDNNWWIQRSAILDPKSRIGSALRRFKGFSILGCGIQWNGERSGEVDFALTAQDDSNVLNLLRTATARGLRVRVVLDDPDRLFTRQGSLDSNLMAGYILGTQALANEVPGLIFINIIKGHVYEAIRDVEEVASLPYDYFSHISWELEELVEMLSNRIQYAGVAPDDVFDGDQEGLTDQLLGEIRNGPRDLLRFIEIIMKSAPNAKVSFETISANRSAFRRAAREQMRTVYGDVYQNLEALAGHLVGPQGVSVSDFHARFKEARMASEPAAVDFKASWIVSAGSALRAMIEAGVVDILQGNRWLRPFERDYFQFDPDDQTAQIRLNAVFQ